MKPRRPTGQLQGPAPTARQVRAVTIRVEQLAGGAWRLSTPTAPGWAAVARTPVEYAQATRRLFTEAQISAHSAWRGTVYDADTVQRRRPARRAKHRSDTYDPREWRLADDGRWVSPRGLRYPPTAQVVNRVRARRVELGLPESPDPVAPAKPPEPEGRQAPIGQASERRKAS